MYVLRAYRLGGTTAVPAGGSFGAQQLGILRFGQASLHISDQQMGYSTAPPARP